MGEGIMAKRHFRNYGREKRIRKEGSEYAEPRKSCAADREGKVSTHTMADKLQVSTHAVNRFAERILDIDKKSIDRKKLWSIAKILRSYLPDNLINESRMHLFDNFYAVINGGIIVTIIERNKKKPCKI